MNKVLNSKCKIVFRAHVGEVIKNKRKNLNLTADTLGAMIGYFSSSVQMWESGHSSPPVAVLYMFAIIFDCPLTDFFPTVSDLIDKTGLKIKETTIRLNRIVVDTTNSKASQ